VTLTIQQGSMLEERMLFFMFGWEKPGTLGNRVSTRLILALLLVLIGLSCATLLIVGRTVRRHVRAEIN
jgi:hypothetical protein